MLESGHIVIALSVLPSVRPTVRPFTRPSQISCPVYNLLSVNGFQYQLAQMFTRQKRCAEFNCHVHGSKVNVTGFNYFVTNFVTSLSVNRFQHNFEQMFTRQRQCVAFEFLVHQSKAKVTGFNYLVTILFLLCNLFIYE